MQILFTLDLDYISKVFNFGKIEMTLRDRVFLHIFAMNRKSWPWMIEKTDKET